MIKKLIRILSSSLGNIDLAVIDGQPHWKERGADTYSPFNSEKKYVNLLNMKYTTNSAQNSAPSFTAEVGKLYFVTVYLPCYNSVPEINCVSGATVLKSSNSLTVGSESFLVRYRVFILRATSTTVSFTTKTQATTYIACVGYSELDETIDWNNISFSYHSTGTGKNNAVPINAEIDSCYIVIQANLSYVNSSSYYYGMTDNVIIYSCQGTNNSLSIGEKGFNYYPKFSIVKATNTTMYTSPLRYDYANNCIALKLPF